MRLGKIIFISFMVIFMSACSTTNDHGRFIRGYSGPFRPSEFQTIKLLRIQDEKPWDFPYDGPLQQPKTSDLVIEKRYGIFSQ